MLAEWLTILPLLPESSLPSPAAELSALAVDIHTGGSSADGDIARVRQGKHPADGGAGNHQARQHTGHNF